MDTTPQKPTEEKRSMNIYRVVDTDNFDGDYPNEKFVGPQMREELAKRIAEILNLENGPNSARYYKVVKLPYTLQPGFEP